MSSRKRKNPHRTCHPIPEVLPKSHTPGSCDNVSTLHSKKTRKTQDLHPAGSCGLTETGNDEQKPQALNQSACPDPSNRLQKPPRRGKRMNGHVSSNSCEPEPKKSTFQKHPAKTSRKGRTKANVQLCDKGDVATSSDVAGNKPCFDRLNNTEPKARDKSDKTKRTRSSKKIQKRLTSSDVSTGLHRRTALSPRSHKQKSSSHTNNDCNSGPCTPKRGALQPCPLLSSTPNSCLRSPNSEISSSPCTPSRHHNITQCSPVQMSSPDDKPIRKVKSRKLTTVGKPERRRKRHPQEPRSSLPSKRCKKNETFLTESPLDKLADFETSHSRRFCLETQNPEIQQKLDESLSSDLSIELSLYQPLSIQEDEEEQDNEEEELPSFLQQDNKKPLSISEGLCVWCKLRKYPYWPAVVKSVKHKGKKASIVFIDGNLTDQKRKRKGFFVCLRTLKAFDCEEYAKLVDAAKEKYGSAITWSLELISDYRIRIGCGSFTGSLIEYCAADISWPVRRKFSEGKSVLTFPSQEILSEQFQSSDDNTEDIAVEEQDDLLSKKVLPDRARAARNRANEKLVDFIVSKRKVENHLLAVIGGQESSQWMQAVKKSTRRVVDVYLEDEEQVDKVYRYLENICDSSPQINNCLEKIQVDRIRLILDVLLPEAIIRAIAGVHKLSLVKAEEKYRSGPCFSKRERQEFDMIIEQQMKLKEIALQQKKNYD